MQTARMQTAGMHADFVVVGGGIIGMLTAYELARAGVKVVLVERGRLGREASWAGAGVLAPLHPWAAPPAFEGLIAFSQDRYPDLARELYGRTGVDCEWERSGLLLLHPPPEAILWARGATRAMPIEGDALTAIEPALHRRGSAIRIPAVAQIRNPRLLRALAAALPQLGVTVREHLQVTSILIRGPRVVGVSTDAGSVSATGVVVAGGAWSNALLQGLGPAPAIAPARGQILLYRAPERRIHHILVRGDHYVVPRRDGRILVGSTLEYVGYDRSTTAAARAELHAGGCAMVPALAECPIEAHWAGLRPASDHGLPTIAAHPRIAGLFVNMGHFRLGLTLAPGSARLLADLVLGRAPCVPPGPYAWPVDPLPNGQGMQHNALRRTLFEPPRKG